MDERTKCMVGSQPVALSKSAAFSACFLFSQFIHYVSSLTVHFLGFSVSCNAMDAL